ncbi:MAG: NADPH-dependent F420 reductase [Myxococcales bacterium]
MKTKIAIAGDGNVGSALQKGLSRAGHEVTAVGRQPGKLKEAASTATIVILAVPYGAVDATLAELGDTIDGKPLVDCTNPLTKEMKLAATGTSAAEELQKKAPRAKVVKAFNTTFAGTMSTGKAKGETLSIYAASDDAAAKKDVLQLARDIGFDAVDAGPLQNARYLEPLAVLNIQLAYSVGLGPDSGFRHVH